MQLYRRLAALLLIVGVAATQLPNNTTEIEGHPTATSNGEESQDGLLAEIRRLQGIVTNTSDELKRTRGEYSLQLNKLQAGMAEMTTFLKDENQRLQSMLSVRGRDGSSAASTDAGDSHFHGRVSGFCWVNLLHRP